MIACLVLVIPCVLFWPTCANTIQSIPDASADEDLLAYNFGPENPPSANALSQSTVPADSSSNNLFPLSGSQTIPSGLFGSTINQITSSNNFQDISDPQEVASSSIQHVPDRLGLGSLDVSLDVSHSQPISSENFQSNIASSDLITSIQSSNADTPNQPVDPDLGSSQVQTPGSKTLPDDPNDPVTVADSNESQKIALDQDIPGIPFGGPIMKAIDSVQQWLENTGTSDQNIPTDCDATAPFSFCCWSGAPTKYTAGVDLKKLTDSRRQCTKMDGLVPNSNCPYLNNIFCCFCGDSHAKRGWAYMCYNPWSRAAGQPDPVPIPKPPNSKAKRANRTPGHKGYPRPADGSESGNRRQGSDDGRPPRPWVCAKDWLLTNYGIGRSRTDEGFED